MVRAVAWYWPSNYNLFGLGKEGHRRVVGNMLVNARCLHKDYPYNIIPFTVLPVEFLLMMCG